MKEIIFEEVGMENYGPYIEPMILKFPSNNITLITGPNGIGKTTALDAIPFTLFGITSKGMKGDELVNNTVKKNCHTWVDFKINDDSYKIERWQKGSKFGNTVSLKKNRVEMYRGAKEVVPEVEKLLCSSKAFMNTLMFGQKVKDFFTDLVDSEKKEIFRKILDLDIYLKYYAKADEILKALRPLVEEIKAQITLNNGLIADANGNISRLNDEKLLFEKKKEESIKKEKESLESSIRLGELHEQNLIELKKKNYDIESTISELSTLQAELDSIEETTKSALSLLQSKRNEKNQELSMRAVNEKSKIIDAATEEKSKIESSLTNEISLLQVQHDKETKELLSNEAKARALHDRVVNLKKDSIELLDSINKDVCPTCNQKIGEECKQLVNKKVSVINETIEKLLADIEKIEELNNRSIENISNIDMRIKGLRDKIKYEIEEIKKTCNEKTLVIDKKLLELTEQVTQIYYSEYSSISAGKDDRKKELKSLIENLKVELDNKRKVKTEIDAELTCIQNTNRIIEMHKREIDNIQNSQYDDKQIKLYVEKRFALTKENQKLEEVIENNLREIDITEFWKAAYSPSGIPSMLIDESIPFMNNRISEYLEKFGGRYVVSFDTLAATKSGEMRDKIAVNVLDTFTKANTRSQLSGGQTRLLDIATILTLGDLQSNIKDFKTNILIFDEIFDALDEENIEYVSKVLTQIKEGRSIYIISHRHVDQVEADEVLALR